MNAPVIEGTQTGEDRYEVTARPDNGIAVTLYVVPVKMPGKGTRFHVKRNPDSLGLITSHTNFPAAAKSANARAKRYVSLYGKKVSK
jgi:hypothetical protein